jgi:hypothetical protein
MGAGCVPIDGSGRATAVQRCPRMRVHIDVGHRPKVPIRDAPRTQPDWRCWEAGPYGVAHGTATTVAVPATEDGSARSA